MKNKVVKTKGNTKPYFDEDGITIYYGDCLEIMPELEPVDLVLTSPPYNSGQTYEKNLSDAEYISFTNKYLDAMDAILRIGGRAAINIAANSISGGEWHQILQILLQKHLDCFLCICWPI